MKMDLKTTVSLLLLLLLGFCNGHNDNAQTNSANSEDRSDTEDITTTILRMNKASTDFLLEGDVIIPKTRNAMKCLDGTNSCLWPKSANGHVEIPFVISDKYDNTDKKNIKTAMHGIQSRTCIRFIPHTKQDGYLSIEPKAGCASLLGYTGNKQVVSLQRYGCVTNGIIQHELLHALGFYHEHSRSDRDGYIRINWANIEEGYASDFEKANTNNLDTPYDYSSVMHYGRTAFGKNDLETITPIPDESVPIGQRNGVSDIDILRINKLYQCLK